MRNSFPQFIYFPPPISTQVHAYSNITAHSEFNFRIQTVLLQEVYTWVLLNAGTFQPFLPPGLCESLSHEFALILLRGHKQRRKMIDRRKEQVSELKENRHYACQQYRSMEGLMALESLWNLDDASEGHKSFFDCGTVAEIYISHVLVLEVWEAGKCAHTRTRARTNRKAHAHAACFHPMCLETGG